MATATAKLGKNWPRAAKQQLFAAYKKVDVPSDQLVQQQDKLEWLTDLFNMSMAFEEADKLSTQVVLQKIISLRKNGELPKLRAHSSTVRAGNS